MPRSSHTRLRRFLLASGFCLAGWCAVSAFDAPSAAAATTHDQPVQHAVLRDVQVKVDTLSGTLSRTLPVRDAGSPGTGSGHHQAHATEGNASDQHTATSPSRPSRAGRSDLLGGGAAHQQGSTGPTRAGGAHGSGTAGGGLTLSLASPSLATSTNALLGRVAHSKPVRAPIAAMGDAIVRGSLATRPSLTRPVRSTLHLTAASLLPVTTAVSAPVRGTVRDVASYASLPAASVTPLLGAAGQHGDLDEQVQGTVESRQPGGTAALLVAEPRCPPDAAASSARISRAHPAHAPSRGSLSWFDGPVRVPAAPGTGAMPGDGSPLAPGTGGTGAGHASSATEAQGSIASEYVVGFGQCRTADERPLGNESGEPQVSPD